MTTSGDNNYPNENVYIGDVRASLLGVRSSTPDNVVIETEGASRIFGSPEALLLSYSNDTTPDVTTVGDRGGSAVDRVLGGGDVVGATMTTRCWNIENSRNDKNNNDNDDEIVAAYYSLGGDVGGSGYSRYNNISPPPESVHSGKFTNIAELSPPPLQHGSSSSSPIMMQQSSSSGGSVGLFSATSSHHRGALGGQGYNNNNNNTNRERTGSQERSLLLTAATTMTNEKKRPPLPPRWAIGSSGVGVGGGMIDIVPLPPPKQVMTGGGEHRRVLSTGDSSFLSNLTDPDSPTPSQQSPSSLSTIQHQQQQQQQQQQSYPPVTSTSATATMTLPPTTVVKPLSVVHHRRGVSWANDPIIAASSHSGEEYKTEEEAAFETLGILQPILIDTEEENKNVEIELDISTPHISNAKAATSAAVVAAAAAADNINMGNPKSGSAFTASFIAAMNAVSNADTIPRSGRGDSDSKVAVTGQQPRTNLWDAVRERKMDILPTTRTSNTSSKQQQISAKNCTPNSLGDVSKKLSRHNCIRSQFGNEVDQLILGALSTHNMTVNDAPTVVGVKLSEEFGDETAGAIQSPPPLTVLPVGHSKHVSALTWTDLSSEPSPKNGVATALGSRQQGESVLEDNAWTPAYDTLGRIDGTLPEERDPKLLITTVVPWGADDVNTAIADAAFAAAGLVSTKSPPPRPVRTSTDGSNRSNESSRSKSSKRLLEDGSTIINDNIEISTNNMESNPENTSDPTENTGLRHRKTKTIAAKSMADELAELAAKSGGGHRHQPTMLTTTTTTGVVDDLFAGVEFIAGQHARAEEENERRKDRPTAAAQVVDNKDNNDGEDASHDEEIGGAGPGKDPLDDDATNDNYRETQVVRKKSSLRQQVKFQMSSYYSDLIKPKLPHFWEKTTRMICFIMLPLLLIAIILFYGAGNPILGSVEIDNAIFGRNETAQVVLGSHVDTIHKSASW